MLVRRLYSSLVFSNAKSSILYVSALESMIACVYTRHPIMFEAVDSSSSIQLISFSLFCICEFVMAILHRVVYWSCESSSTCVCE